MKLICEINEELEYLSEENNGVKNHYIKGVFMQGNLKNRHGRVYPMEVLQKEVARYNKEYIDRKRAFGELGHPAGPTINLDRVSHMIQELKQDGNNFVGKAKIMDTPMGNIVKNLMNEGATIGVSSRGMGSLKERNGIAEVQNDFFLATAADIVADPSAPDAFVEGIMEGVNFWFDDNGILHREIVAERARQEIEQAAKTKTLDEDVKMKIFKNYIESL
jgi:hypothetical protein